MMDGASMNWIKDARFVGVALNENLHETLEAFSTQYP